MPIQGNSMASSGAKTLINPDKDQAEFIAELEAMRKEEDKVPPPPPPRTARQQEQLEREMAAGRARVAYNEEQKRLAVELAQKAAAAEAAETVTVTVPAHHQPAEPKPVEVPVDRNYKHEKDVNKVKGQAI